MFLGNRGFLSLWFTVKFTSVIFNAGLRIMRFVDSTADSVTLNNISYSFGKAFTTGYDLYSEIIRNLICIKVRNYTLHVNKMKWM